VAASAEPRAATSLLAGLVGLVVASVAGMVVAGTAVVPLWVARWAGAPRSSSPTCVQRHHPLTCNADKFAASLQRRLAGPEGSLPSRR